jgi:cytoskeletal protein CcmA (bactofilin family)
MPLNLEETFREFAGDAASGLGTDTASAGPVPAQPAATNTAVTPAPAQSATQTQPTPAPANVPADIGEETGEALVSKNFKIMGDLNCHDILRIEGYVEGNIECRTLTVCESARIKGNIRAKTVDMSGKVIGTIEAGTLTLNRPSIVAGDLIVHDQLGIEPGAHFEGSCKRVSTKKAAQPQVQAQAQPQAQTKQAAPAATQTNSPATAQRAPNATAIPAE